MTQMADLTALCNKMTWFVDEGRAPDVAYFDFNNAFSSVSHNVLVSRLGHHSLHGWTTRWVDNWLGGWAQRVVVKELYSA